MSRRYLVLSGCLVLLGVLVDPPSVRAGGDPLASPTPPAPGRVASPEITGLCPAVSLSEGIQGETHPSDIFSGLDISVPGPKTIEVESSKMSSVPEMEVSLAVPLRRQAPGSVHCGPAALGMAMDYMNLKMGGRNPSTPEIVAFLEERGMIYGWGTGVEELVYAARAYGYPGSRSFNNWTLEDLAEQLKMGNPVVVPLGEKPGEPGHFITIIGISRERSQVACNDPITGKRYLPVAEFLINWEYQGRTGMVVHTNSLATKGYWNLLCLGLLSNFDVFL